MEHGSDTGVFSSRLVVGFRTDLPIIALSGF